MSRFQGDPFLILGPSGSTLKFKGGQPVMDGGLETPVSIALFTAPGWVGNDLFDNPDQKIGSDFEEKAKRAITLSSLNDTREAAERALAPLISSNVASSIEVTVTNPSSRDLRVRILITPPGGDVQELLLTRHGLNWIIQGNDPAHLQV